MKKMVDQLVVRLVSQAHQNSSVGQRLAGFINDSLKARPKSDMLQLLLQIIATIRRTSTGNTFASRNNIIHVDYGQASSVADPNSAAPMYLELFIESERVAGQRHVNSPGIDPQVHSLMHRIMRESFDPDTRYGLGRCTTLESLQERFLMESDHASYLMFADAQKCNVHRGIKCLACHNETAVVNPFFDVCRFIYGRSRRAEWSRTIWYA
jgi:hypothetical protein